MHVEKTVFISYRRTNVYMARAVHLSLVQRGYDVFLDFQSIDSGSFEQIILRQIDARAHFVIVLTPSALERCTEPHDWLRREIERAIDTQRNIVPLMFDPFDFGAVQQYLVGKLAVLPEYQALRIPPDYFEEAIERLCTRFLNKPLAMVIHPTPPEDQEEVAERQVQAETAPAPAPEQLSAEQHFESGVAHQQNGELARAIDDYTAAIRLNPAYAFAYNNRGVARRDQGDLDGAMEDYNEAIRIDPQYALVYNNRGTIRAEQGDLDGAIEDFNEAIRLNPQEVLAFFNRGNARKEKHDLDGAIDDYTEAIRLRPQYADAYTNRGIARSDQGNLDGAIEDFNEAIRLNPQDGSAFNNRGFVRFKQDDLDSAIADYTEAIRLNPQNTVAYGNRGLAHQKQGNLDGAIADYNEVIRLDSQDTIAYINRGEVYFELGIYRAALADFTAADQITPDDNMTRAGLAISQHALGNIPEAQRIWRELIAQDTRFRDAEWVRAELNWAEPLVDEARKLIAGL